MLKLVEVMIKYFNTYNYYYFPNYFKINFLLHLEYSVAIALIAKIFGINRLDRYKIRKEVLEFRFFENIDNKPKEQYAVSSLLPIELRSLSQFSAAFILHPIPPTPIPIGPVTAANDATLVAQSTI